MLALHSDHPQARLYEGLEAAFGELLPAERPMSDSERADYLDREAAKSSFKAFMERMFPGYVDGWHIQLLRDKLEAVERGKVKRLIVTMPPRHSKSRHVSEGFPAWYLGRHPDERIIAASHTQELAFRFSRSVRRLLQDDARWPFERVHLERGNTNIKTWGIDGHPDGGYYSVGVGGSPTGLGGNLIIDDPIRSQEDADSPIILDKLWDWFSGTLYTRRQPGSFVIVTATRWHENDLTGRLLDRMTSGGEHWDHLYLPAENERGEFLWPDFWPASEYELAKLSSPRVWNAQYMGRPTTKGGELLREEWFGDVQPRERYDQIVISWDTSKKVGIDNDYSVGMTIARGELSYDVLRLYRDRVPFPELVNAVIDQYTLATNLYRDIPVTVLIEDAASGTSLLQTLQGTTRIPVIPVKSTRTNEKELRVIEVTPTVRAGRVRLARGEPWIGAFLQEIQLFPYGQHDDIVDAFTIGLRYLSGVGGGSTVTVDRPGGRHEERHPFAWGRQRGNPWTR